MKKILYITTIDKTVNAFLIPHIKYLIDAGNIVDVACNIGEEKNRKLLELKVKYHQVDFSRNPFNLSNNKAKKQIKEIQKKHKYDIVHVHTPVASFVTRYALKDEKIKMVYTCHGFHFYKGAPLLNWLIYYNLEKKAAEWTDQIVTINNEDFDRAKKFKLRNNGKVQLMHGVGIGSDDYKIKNFNRKLYREKMNIKPDDFMILILAEINKNKNHIQIIKAMERIKNKENIKVICAGEGPLLSKYKKYILEKGLEENIRFIGFRKDIKELLNSCDCVALFSKREGLGKCLLEGMCVGKPIIATQSRGAKELVQNNINGYLIKFEIEDTIEAIEKISRNKLQNEIFGKESINLIEKYYVENVLKYIKIYNMV